MIYHCGRKRYILSDFLPLPILRRWEMTASAVHEIEPCAYGKYRGGAYGRISPPMLGEGILYRKRRRRETGHLKNSLCNTSWYYWMGGGEPTGSTVSTCMCVVEGEKEGEEEEEETEATFTSFMVFAEKEEESWRLEFFPLLLRCLALLRTLNFP